MSEGTFYFLFAVLVAETLVVAILVAQYRKYSKVYQANDAVAKEFLNKAVYSTAAEGDRGLRDPVKYYLLDNLLTFDFGAIFSAAAYDDNGALGRFLTVVLPSGKTATFLIEELLGTAGFFLTCIEEKIGDPLEVHFSNKEGLWKTLKLQTTSLAIGEVNLYALEGGFVLERGDSVIMHIKRDNYAN